MSMAVILAGCSSTVSSDSINVTAAKVKVQTDIEDTLYSSVVEASEKMEVIPIISGKVSEVYGELGQRVEKGAVLFQIDKTDLLLQMKQSQATYEAAVASYQKTVGGSAQQTVLQLKQTVDKANNELNDSLISYNTLKTAFDNKTDITPSQINYDESKANYDRIQQLFNSGAETAVNLENAKNKMNTAKAQLDSITNTVQTNLNNAESRLKNAKTALSAANENLNITVNKVNPENAKNASAQMESTKVSLEMAQKKLNDATVTAPMSGIISTKMISEGDIVSTQQSAMTLINTDIVEIPVQVTETNISRINLNMNVNVSIQSTGEVYRGAVSEISPTSDSNTGMFTIKIKVDNKKGILKEGMTVNVRFFDGNKSTVVLVPNEAIITDENLKYVYTLINGKPVKREVKIGNELNQYVEITEGLKIDDMVIVQGSSDIDENSKINIIDSRGMN